MHHKMIGERNANSGDELTTWQQISQYLQVTDRTAQNWHRTRGLPVRKIGGRVTASIAELDSWKRSQTGDAPAQPEPFEELPVNAPRKRRLLLSRSLVFLLAPAIVVVVALASVM